jgi:hypothetical protein
MKKSEKVVLLACGDVGPVHGKMEEYGALLGPTFATGDIRFAQCERLYSNAYSAADEPGTNVNLGHGPLPPEMISIFTDSGFDVVSLAGNHTMEWGDEVALDTIELFGKKGIRVVGAGPNLDAARAPVYVEKNGVRVAFLARCSVVREDHVAGPNKCGVAPVRAHTTYEAVEWQAGMPPRIITVPYEEDLQHLKADIAEAREAADVVVLSLHWGLHYIPRRIAEYQPIVTKTAFDAGVDLILGHHPHVPKAIEARGRNKACFYSLGNFMFSTDTGLKPGFEEKMRFNGLDSDFDEFPHCPHGRDSKRSLIAKAVLSRDGMERASFLPVQIDTQLRPEVLTHDDPRFIENVDFMEWVSVGFDHRFEVEGEEVVVTGSE